MAKEFSKFFVASLKRTAQNVHPLVRQKEKLIKEIRACEEALSTIQAQIDGYQIPIKEATGGFTTEDLIVRTVTETGKVDKEGRPIKTTQYNLKYPDTIIPVEGNTAIEEEEHQEELPFMTEDVINSSTSL